MQELVAELKKHVVFKETTGPGDLVLIAADNPRMLVYARVETIEPDTGRKDSWWHVTMQLLTVPLNNLILTHLLREGALGWASPALAKADSRGGQSQRCFLPSFHAASFTYDGQNLELTISLNY